MKNLNLNSESASENIKNVFEYTRLKLMDHKTVPAEWIDYIIHLPERFRHFLYKYAAIFFEYKTGNSGEPLPDPIVQAISKNVDDILLGTIKTYVNYEKEIPEVMLKSLSQDWNKCSELIDFIISINSTTKLPLYVLEAIVKVGPSAVLDFLDNFPWAESGRYTAALDSMFDAPVSDVLFKTLSESPEVAMKFLKTHRPFLRADEYGSKLSLFIIYENIWKKISTVPNEVSFFQLFDLLEKHILWNLENSIKIDESYVQLFVKIFNSVFKNNFSRDYQLVFFEDFILVCHTYIKTKTPVPPIISKTFYDFLNDPNQTERNEKLQRDVPRLLGHNFDFKNLQNSLTIYAGLYRLNPEDQEILINL